MTAKASVEEPGINDFVGVVLDAAQKFKAEMGDVQMPTIDIGNITTILLGVGGGFLSGMFEVTNNSDGARCFNGIQNVTAVIQEVQRIIGGGLEKDPVKMTRQILVLAVMVLNATIDEYTYCQNVMTLVNAFYYTFQCIVSCRSYYYRQFSSRVISNTFNYFYYIKEAIRVFLNKDYHLSGNWAAYAADSLIMQYGSCYGTGGSCYA